MWNIGSDFETLLDRSALDVELILPVQWNRGQRRDALRYPEKRLMLAILEDAVATLGRNAAESAETAPHELKEVEIWCSSDDTTWPFSFVNICDHLGLDPDALRTGLRRWREARAHGMPARRLRRRPSGVRTRLSSRAA